VDSDDLGDGVVATRLVPDVHLIPGLWGIDGYSSISAMITSTFDVVPGRTFLEMPYDWRRDNRVAARRLAAIALPALRAHRRDNPDAKLVLVGHSMGGLVARYFLECMDGWRDTRMLITFGTPFRGSLSALNFIANGFAKKIGPFKMADLSMLLRSFTSVYQLLPVYPCIDSEDGEMVRPAESSGVPNLDLDRAHTAEDDFHRAIERAVTARAVEQPYQIHPVVGLNQPTLQGARLVGGRLDVRRTYGGEDLDGDGTVPRVSATPIELDGRHPDPCVYVPERHASLQNALSVQTQLLGVLTPVPRPERFRDVRGGLRLDLDDLYAAGEEIPVRVTADVRRVDLIAEVIDLDTKRPVAGPLPLVSSGDEVDHAIDLPPLPRGTYRIEIGGRGEDAGLVQPVRGVFLVAEDEPR
jgi:pimeloyl-ACP methyl ester carboxylesterase